MNAKQSIRKQRSRPVAGFFVLTSKNYFFLAAFFFPPFFFAAFFAAFFFMAMVRSPVLEWNTRAIPRWIGGRTTVNRGTRPIRYALVQRARISVLLSLRRLKNSFVTR